MVGKNPIVLVGTKLDLRPEGAHPKDVAEWLMESATRKRLNVVSCHLVSSHSGEGVSSATSKICRERKGRDVYVIGAANVREGGRVRSWGREYGGRQCGWERVRMGACEGRPSALGGAQSQAPPTTASSLRPLSLMYPIMFMACRLGSRRLCVRCCATWASLTAPTSTPPP